MITLLNKNSLYSTFGVEDFNALGNIVNDMAPSLVEYYLSDLCDYSNINDCENGFYLNRRNIENQIQVGEYCIYIDYNEDIYLEIDIQEEEYETGSLW